MVIPLVNPCHVEAAPRPPSTTILHPAPALCNAVVALPLLRRTTARGSGHHMSILQYQNTRQPQRSAPGPAPILTSTDDPHSLTTMHHVKRLIVIVIWIFDKQNPDGSN